jgi:hypothetical protein
MVGKIVGRPAASSIRILLEHAWGTDARRADFNDENRARSPYSPVAVLARQFYMGELGDAMSAPGPGCVAKKPPLALQNASLRERQQSL